MKKLLILLYCIVRIKLFYIFYSHAHTKKIPKNVLKLTCEFDPSLIKKEINEIGFVENDKIDNQQICKNLGCKDFIEVNQIQHI